MFINFFLREVSADLGVILAAHVEEVMDKGIDEQPTPRNLINIRRTHVLEDGLKKLKKTSFVASRTLSVKFSQQKMIVVEVKGRSILVDQQESFCVLQ